MVLVDANGKPFKRGLLDISDITREALKILEGQFGSGEESQTFADRYVNGPQPKKADMFAIAALRQSCGAKNEPLKFNVSIRRPVRHLKD